jgi:hypothetical protein
MKTTEHVNAVSFLRKLLKLGLFAALILTCLNLKSQDSTAKSLTVYPTFGLGIGFFYPEDVNQYIEDEIVAGYGSSYNTNMYMYLEVKGGVTFRLKQVDFSALLEYDIAPKFVMVSDGDNFSYTFSRISPEISANYYIPSRSGKNAFFIGGGVNYSFMTFKEFSASNPGFKIQLGYSMQMGKFNLQPYGAFRYVKATDSSSSDPVWDNFELSYTGGQIGVLLSFHPPVKYK